MPANLDQLSIANRVAIITRLSILGLDLIPLVGKQPIDVGWRKKRFLRDRIVAHVANGGNVGVRLKSHHLILDVDPRNGGDKSLERLCSDVGLRATDGPIVRTGGGGMHIYLSKPESMRVFSQLARYPGIDIKSEGFQVVAPGSIHPETKKAYELEDPLEEIGAPPAAPAALIALLERKPLARTLQDDPRLDPTELASILSLVDVRSFGHVDGASNYEKWRNFSMACHAVTGGLAEAEWLDWCLSDPNYAGCAPELSSAWASFDASRSDGIGLGTLRHNAAEFPAAYDKLTAILAVKDFEPFGPDELASFDDEAPSQVTQLVETMNKRFCAVLEGGQFAIFMHETDDTFSPPRHYYARMSREHFRSFHEDERIRLPDSGKEISVADVWLKHPKRRKYAGIVMDPRDDADTNKLNLWRGWAVNSRSGDWSLLRQLIEETLCSGDQASSEYVKKWIAFMLQRPAISPETAIAFRGGEGTGKGTLGRTLLRIAGPHGLTVASPSQFAGRFNSHLRDCLFLFADEAFWPGSKEAEGTLKQLVTEPVISYEAKGRDIVPGRNLVHLMMASNEQWIVPAGPDARRFAVFDVSNNRQNDRSFFGALWEQLENGGLEGMVYDLMRYELGDWHPSRDMPKTEALADQKVRALSPAMKWWHEILTRGVLPATVQSNTDWSVESVTLGEDARRDMIDDFDRFLKRNNIYHEKALHKALVSPGKLLGLRLTKIEGGAERAWVLPPLEEMRAALGGHVGSADLFEG